MAVIDLKYAIITIRDGATGITSGISDAGAVNNASGYAAGATSFIVDALAGIVHSGQTFTVTGETGSPTHTVVGHTETAGNTTSVSFTPALASSIADNVVVTFVAEATGTNTIEVKIGEGTLTYTEKRNMEYRRDRGLLNTVREGDEEPVEVSLDFEWEFLRSSTGEDVTIEEALKQTGAASDWISSSADTCEPYAVDVVITYIPPCDDADTEVIVLQDFRWETLDHNLKDGQISVKGQCNVKEAVVTREAQAMPMGMAVRNNRAVDISKIGIERTNQVQKKIMDKRKAVIEARNAARQGQEQQAAPAKQSPQPAGATK